MVGPNFWVQRNQETTQEFITKLPDLTRNQEPEITRRPPGIRAGLVWQSASPYPRGGYRRRRFQPAKYT
jgi:hypothetical protein